MITFLSLGKYGELGNQLFQIAATIGYATLFNKEYIFPKWFCVRSQLYYNQYLNTPLNDNLNIDTFTNFKTYSETGLNYTPFVDQYFDNINLFGYFQCEKYFKHCSEFIKNIFSPNKDVESKIHHLDFKNSVSIQLRFYDRDYYDPSDVYISIEENIEFLKKSIDFFGKNKVYIVNTNNILKAKKLFAKYDNFLYLDQFSNIEQFFIQTKCENNIITNSSFGWWGAYLNSSQDKLVCAPRKWFRNENENWTSSKDIIPPEWKIY